MSSAPKTAAARKAFNVPTNNVQKEAPQKVVAGCSVPDASHGEEEMKEFKEKERILRELHECDMKIQTYETSLYNIHNGQVKYIF